MAEKVSTASLCSGADAHGFCAEIAETLEDRIRAVIRVGALREREYPASVAVRVMQLCASCLRLLHGFKRGRTASTERGTHVPDPMTDQGIWL